MIEAIVDFFARYNLTLLCRFFAGIAGVSAYTAAGYPISRDVMNVILLAGLLFAIFGFCGARKRRYGID